MYQGEPTKESRIWHITDFFHDALRKSSPTSADGISGVPVEGSPASTEHDPSITPSTHLSTAFEASLLTEVQSLEELSEMIAMCYTSSAASGSRLYR